MRVLLIEDDSSMSQSVNMMLTGANCVVDTADLGEDGLDLAKIYEYDAILLDLNLPDMTGHEVLRQLRAAKNDTPVIMLSGVNSIDAKVKSFTSGADDFVTKPFHKDELIARMNAIVRRSKGHAQSLITVGAMTVDLDNQAVMVGANRLNFTKKEYQLVELLALRKGATITKEMILNHLYGGMDEPEQKIIDVFICKLRKKISSATGGQALINTVWGRGYVLNDPSEAPVAA